MLYLAIIFFALVASGLTVLAFANFSNEVTIFFFGWQMSSVSVGLALLLAFFLGALMLYIVSVAAAWKDTYELKALRQQVDELKQSTLQASSSPPPAAPIVPMPGMPGPDISDMPTQH